MNIANSSLILLLLLLYVKKTKKLTIQIAKTIFSSFCKCKLQKPVLISAIFFATLHNNLSQYYEVSSSQLHCCGLYVVSYNTTSNCLKYLILIEFVIQQNNYQNHPTLYCIVHIKSHGCSEHCSH